MARFIRDPLQALQGVSIYHRIIIANSAMAVTVIVTLLTSQTAIVAGTVAVACGITNALLVRAAFQVEAQRRSQRELLAHTLTQTELQRTDVARQLTEDAAQRLAVLALRASGDRKISAEATSVMQDLCDTARTLYPPGMELLGLKGALECYSRSLHERIGARVRVAADHQLIQLAQGQALGIYRMLEAVIESAAARGLNSVDLFVGIEDDNVQVTLQLDQMLSSSDRFNLSERVAVLGGNSKTAYRNDQTIVSISIPAMMLSR